MYGIKTVPCSCFVTRRKSEVVSLGGTTSTDTGGVDVNGWQNTHTCLPRSRSIRLLPSCFVFCFLLFCIIYIRIYISCAFIYFRYFSLRCTWYMVCWLVHVTHFVSSALTWHDTALANLPVFATWYLVYVYSLPGSMWPQTLYRHTSISTVQCISLSRRLRSQRLYMSIQAIQWISVPRSLWRQRLHTSIPYDAFIT